LGGLRTAQIAITDFLHGYGTYEELAARVGLSPEGIESAVLEVTASGAATTA